MSRFSTFKKVITLSLIVAILILAFPAMLFGIQMVEAQKKVHDLQSQLAQYQNMTDTLQTQTSNLETQINQLQNPTDNVTLTVSVGYWYTGEYAPPPYTKDINITLQNFGTRSIGGMILDFKVEGNTTNIGYYDIHVISGLLGVLHVLESKSMKIRLIAPTKEGTQVLENCRLTITLLLDEVVLDRKTVTIGA
jgi:type II secretory pathway pseudopilin PulG